MQIIIWALWLSCWMEQLWRIRGCFLNTLIICRLRSCKSLWRRYSCCRNSLLWVGFRGICWRNESQSSLVLHWLRFRQHLLLELISETRWWLLEFSQVLDTHCQQYKSQTLTNSSINRWDQLSVPFHLLNQVFHRWFWISSLVKTLWSIKQQLNFSTRLAQDFSNWRSSILRTQLNKDSRRVWINSTIQVWGSV